MHCGSMPLQKGQNTMENIASIAARLREETQKIIVGKHHQIDLILMSIFSGGASSMSTP